MNKNAITLTPDDILNKEFKIDTRGYRLKEVDQFLDTVINDYETYDEIIKNLEREKEEEKEEIFNLKQEIRELKTTIEIKSSSTTSKEEFNNLDVLKRLSKLEKDVYGRDD